MNSASAESTNIEDGIGLGERGTEILGVRKVVDYRSVARSKTRLVNSGNLEAEDEAGGSLVAGNSVVEMDSNDSIVISTALCGETQNC